MVEIPVASRRLPRRVPVGFAVGVVILLGFVAVAALADVLAPHDPYSQSLLRRLRQPVWSGGTWIYPLGTDSFGRDYLSRLIYGTRISLAVGFGGAAVASIIGAALGMAAGYFGGLADRVVSFVIATRLALPSLLFALAILQIAGSGLFIVILVLALTHWDRYAVVMRTAVRQTARLDYVTRAKVMGASDLRILAQEIAPNVAGSFIVIFTFEVAQCILAAATLSFLGLGIQAPEPSWGLMMSEGRNLLAVNPWLITLAGLTLMALVLAVNLVGDGLRAMFGHEPARERSRSRRPQPVGRSRDGRRYAPRRARDFPARRPRRNPVHRRRKRLRKIDDLAGLDGPAAARGRASRRKDRLCRP